MDDASSFEEGFCVEAEGKEAEVTAEEFGPIVKKLRALICHVRKSTAVNDTLQKYAFEETGSPLTLILDVKTRWSSLQEMLDRAVVLKKAIQKTAIDHKIAQNKVLTDSEFQVRSCV